MEQVPWLAAPGIDTTDIILLSLSRMGITIGTPITVIGKVSSTAPMACPRQVVGEDVSNEFGPSVWGDLLGLVDESLVGEGVTGIWFTVGLTVDFFVGEKVGLTY